MPGDVDRFQNMTGALEKERLRLTSRLGSGLTAGQVVVDLAAVSRPRAAALALSAWERMFYVVVALPLMASLRVFRYRPWTTNVWVVAFLTLFAGASGGLSWAVALLVALSGQRAVSSLRDRDGG